MEAKKLPNAVNQTTAITFRICRTCLICSGVACFMCVMSRPKSKIKIQNSKIPQSINHPSWHQNPIQRQRNIWDADNESSQRQSSAPSYQRKGAGQQGQAQYHAGGPYPVLRLLPNVSPLAKRPNLNCQQSTVEYDVATQQYKNPAVRDNRFKSRSHFHSVFGP
jgi:hypothetical protein